MRARWVLLLACLAGLTSRANEATPKPPLDLSRFRADRILIKPKQGVSLEKLGQLHSRNQCAVIGHFRALGNVQVLRLPQGPPARGLISNYAASALVDYAEPDYLVRTASAFPNDPRFLDGTLWGLNNAGQNGGKANADIDAPEAWGLVRSASNIIVAVLDTGVRYSHEDLSANMWVNSADGSHGTNALTGTTDPNDDSGHGTLVAGVIGASGNNGTGVVGAAWQAQIMACKFVDSSGQGSVSDAIACIEYARSHAAHIINASWGLEQFSLSLSDAIKAAREAGIILVAAAGNDAHDNDLFPFYPASYELDNIVVVAATTRTDEMYPLSDFGSTGVDLAAPGYEIYSTYHQSDRSYALDQGTSMAAAFVSGALALLRANYPSETHTHLINRLLTATDTLPGLAGKCATGGRLNLRKALGVPVANPTLRAVLPTHSGQFELHLQGDPGRLYALESSSNLVNWVSVLTNLSTLDGSSVFTNGELPYQPSRFYRAWLIR